MRDKEPSIIAVDMTTQNAVPCGLQAVVAIHRNQGQIEVARLRLTPLNGDSLSPGGVA
jgi:hypothetical protein